MFGRSGVSLARVYVEPTTLCDLLCRTCIRDRLGRAAGNDVGDTFARVMDAVREVSPRPTVFFSGFGKPFAHPDLLAMLAEVKAAGCRVELITNGTLLDDATAPELMRSGSTGCRSRSTARRPRATPTSACGTPCPVIEDLAALRDLRLASRSAAPKLGIAFVAMKRNIADLPEVIRLGQRLGADRFSVSNVLAHTPEMRDQVLYAGSIDVEELDPSPWSPEVSLPRMDIDARTLGQLVRAEADRRGRTPSGRQGDGRANACPFVEKGSVSVRWDGAISPCLPLLHTHRSYLDFRPRTNHAFAVANVNDRGLLEAWNDPAYVALRERLLAFDFAPCTICNSCDMADENLEDCFGSPAPACGGCLWAQGFIQCP